MVAVNLAEEWEVYFEEGDDLYLLKLGLFGGCFRNSVVACFKHWDGGADETP